ncbi:MAG: homoserine dehydrogenase [Lachnospiraceae bacterium]|nr:homoserine dehydrogenase [Lachnospiraceae bacterium]
MTSIAILGYGTVGSGVAHVLDENTGEVRASAHDDVRVKAILDLREFPGDPHEKQVTHDFQTILDDPEIRVVCETMGGVNPAYEFTKKALQAGKSVCTSNKELVAKHGPELVRIARENRVSYLFEASVGGGIPILRTLEGALKSERITGITGILNGTTNYILTRMDQEGASFEDVLRQAQELGYAERDPSADIEGHDACRKIAILGSLMMGGYVDSESVPTEGITRISTADLSGAREFGMAIKLLGHCRCTDKGLDISVAPYLIGRENPLASVNGVFNAIAVDGNMLGTSMYYGQGAGRDATASAVVADVCEIVRNAGSTVPVSMSADAVELAPAGDGFRRYFLRVDGSHAQEAQAAFEGSTCKTVKGADGAEEACLLTGKLRESAFTGQLESLSGVRNWIRVLDE